MIHNLHKGADDHPGVHSMTPTHEMRPNFLGGVLGDREKCSGRKEMLEHDDMQSYVRCLCDDQHWHRICHLKYSSALEAMKLPAQEAMRHVRE